MRSPNLRGLFPALLALVPLAACTTETSMDVSAACPLADSARYKALSFASGIDGITFRALGTRQTNMPVGDDVGTVCARAGDVSACRAKVAATTASTGWRVSFSGFGDSDQEYGVATRGDEIFVVDSKEALGKAIAPIDTPEEAVAFVKLAVSPVVKCGEPNVSLQGNGYVVKTVNEGACGGSSETLYVVGQDGALGPATSKELSSASSGCAEGRRPNGLVEIGAPWLASLGEHFAEIAHMEAAAVIAFDQLVADLLRFGAPLALVERAKKARAEEVEHATVTHALASRFGGTPREPSVGGVAPDSTLLQFALENAREGCVRETYGALVAAHQAEHARDPAVRSAFAKIHAEELEHAELSWDIAAWASARLTSRENELVTRASYTAISELEALHLEPCADVRELAGMPDARTHRALVAGLAPALVVLVAA